MHIGDGVEAIKQDDMVQSQPQMAMPWMVKVQYKN